MKYPCFFPLQQRTIIASPIPVPSKANQGNEELKKNKASAKSATINNAKRTWFKIFNSARL